MGPVALTAGHCGALSATLARTVEARAKRATKEGPGLLRGLCWSPPRQTASCCEGASLWLHEGVAVVGPKLDFFLVVWCNGMDRVGYV